MSGSAEELQRQYYAQVAEAYDHTHVHKRDEHYLALKYMTSIMNMMQLKSVLDVGCGTGRALAYLIQQGFQVHGIEPVQDLINVALSKPGVLPEMITKGSGTQLPFDDDSFDAVCEVAVFHHVKDPALIVKEMMRVARKAIFISDSNRFGQGSQLGRIGKLLLYKSGLWGAVNWLSTGGKGYWLSEGDGLAFSYSIYDSFNQLAGWADRIFVIPTRRGQTNSWFHPLLTNSHALLCAVKGDFPD